MAKRISIIPHLSIDELEQRYDVVEDLVERRCRQLLQQQELIQGLTFYHWWPEVKVA